MMCATHDFFDISGTWDSIRYAKRLFTRTGYAERVDILENDLGHNYDTDQHEAAARWLSRWLLQKDQVIKDLQFAMQDAEPAVRANAFALPTRSPISPAM